MADSLGTALRDEVLHLFGPVVAASRSTRGAALLLRGLGYTDAIATRPDLAAALADLAAAAGAIEAIDDLDSWQAIQQLLESIARAGDAIDALGASGLASLGRELADKLVSTYLRARFPRLFRMACLLTLIDPAEAMPALPLERDGAAIARLPRRVDRLRFDRARRLVSAPLDMLAEVYFPNQLATASDAHAAAARVFEPLVRLLDALGVFTRVDLADTEPPRAMPSPVLPDDDSGDHLDNNEIDPDEGTTDPSPEATVDVALFHRRFRPRLIAALPMPDGPARVGVAFTASSAEHPDHVPGLVVGLVGALALAHDRGDWRLETSATGDIPGFVVGPGGVKLAPSAGANVDAAVHIALQRIRQENGPAFVLGAASGTRVELGSVTVRLDATLRHDRPSIALTFDTRPSALVLAPGDGDGFLRRVLSRESRLPLDVGIVLSSDGGLRLLGGAGLDARSSASIELGPVTVTNPRLALSTAEDAILVAATCDVAAALGPVRVTMTGIGVAMEARIPAAAARWPLSLAPGFMPPNGAAIAVESPVVRGGGFLARDPGLGRYLGALSLGIGPYQVVGAGVLDTRLPDVSDGYSLAAIAAARFPRVQLGWGFTLDGLGAFIGVDRAVDVDALRAGLRDGGLARLLAPVDPIVEAPAIVASLARYFPAQPGGFVIGPTARIGWGTPAMLQADLALLFEQPSVRVIALAAVQVGLPTLERRILDLRMDVLGVLDLARRLLSVDGSLHHSTLAGYPLTGDIALRARLDANPHFLLAIGGFHPRFRPPPAFPSLQRIALTIGDNPRLRLEAYLAHTLGMLQFGALVDLSYRVAGLSIGGHLQFDTLIALLPFHVDAEVDAKVSISYKGFNIASARLSFLLQGPRPWHARGKATISILWWDVSVGFDVSWGERVPLTLPAPPDVAKILRDGLGEASAWSSELPSGEPGWLVLRDLRESDGLRVHPLGALVVRQRAVPLGLNITAFGTVPLPRAVRFSIESVQIGSEDRVTEPVQDVFAPAQFAALRADQRLAAPPFETMTSGVRVRDKVLLGATARVTMDRNTAVQDPLAPPRRPGLSKVPATTVAIATAQRTLGKAGHPPMGAVRLYPAEFVLASTRALSITARGARIARGETSYAALREAMRGATDDAGLPVRGLQIVPRAVTANARSRVVVVREDEKLRNVDFVDTVTGISMTRGEFVEEIRAGRYSGYAVRSMHGVDTPVSKPNATVDDNLG